MMYFSMMSLRHSILSSWRNHRPALSFASLNYVWDKFSSMMSSDQKYNVKNSIMNNTDSQPYQPLQKAIRSKPQPQSW